MKFWNTPQFKELQYEWYDKLQAFGHNDIELDGEIKQNAPNSYRQACKIAREAKLEYHLLLTHYLNEKELDNDVDDLVMTWLSEGRKIKDICEELMRIGERCHRDTVRFIKRKYENRWGIRKWKPEQMKSNPSPKKPIR